MKGYFAILTALFIITGAIVVISTHAIVDHYVQVTQTSTPESIKVKGSTGQYRVDDGKVCVSMASQKVEVEIDGGTFKGTFEAGFCVNADGRGAGKILIIITDGNPISQAGLPLENSQRFAYSIMSGEVQFDSDNKVEKIQLRLKGSDGQLATGTYERTSHINQLWGDWFIDTD